MLLNLEFYLRSLFSDGFFGVFSFLATLVLVCDEHTRLRTRPHALSPTTCWYNPAGKGLVSYFLCVDLRSLRESGLPGCCLLAFVPRTKPELSSLRRCSRRSSFTFLQPDFFSFVLKSTTANRRLIWKALVFSFSLCSLLQFFSLNRRLKPTHLVPCSSSCGGITRLQSLAQGNNGHPPVNLGCVRRTRQLLIGRNSSVVTIPCSSGTRFSFFLSFFSAGVSPAG